MSIFNIWLLISLIKLLSHHWNANNFWFREERMRLRLKRENGITRKSTGYLTLTLHSCMILPVWYMREWNSASIHLRSHCEMPGWNRHFRAVRPAGSEGDGGKTESESRGLERKIIFDSGQEEKGMNWEKSLGDFGRSHRTRERSGFCSHIGRHKGSF